MLPDWANSFLVTLLKVGALLMTLIDLPFGTSSMALAQRAEQAAKWTMEREISDEC
jgi:hypothetical protein